MKFINNPFPNSLDKEADKAANVLASFIGSSSVLSANQVIPPSILANAKGLAVLSVLKAAFLGSGRFGSGIVVARLPDGSWSPPSAVGTLGVGFGGQIGFEFTDFVFILNDASAVKTFTQAGSLTFGGNVSIAAGPIGRNAEAAGAANLKSVAAIFAYSKTKGLFAGVSLEGGGMIERSDENRKAYGQMATAEKILSGQVVVSPEKFPSLNRILSSSVFSSSMYRDGATYSDSDDDRTGAYGRGPARAQAWQSASRDPFSNEAASYSNPDLSRSSVPTTINANSRSSLTPGKKPPPPVKPKPRFQMPNQPTGPNQAVAKFTFEAAQPGDLGFRKGDLITIIQRTDKQSDWWTGRIGDREGIFPSNYVTLGQ